MYQPRDTFSFSLGIHPGPADYVNAYCHFKNESTGQEWTVTGLSAQTETEANHNLRGSLADFVRGIEVAVDLAGGWGAESNRTAAELYRHVKYAMLKTAPRTF